VYLVDNGSTDGSCEYIMQRYPTVKTIRFERNLGFAQAYNRSVATIAQDYVVFLNNDVEVERGWLAELRKAMERGVSRDAVCGSKLLLYHDRGSINHAGGKLLPIGGGIDMDLMNPDREEPHRYRFVGCVSGASMILPRSVFLGLGGFDIDFFAYFEDVDFCWRAWLAGYRVLHVPSSRAYHKLSATMGPLLRPERLFLGERNRLQSMLKNLELRNVILGLFASSLYNVFRFLQFSRRREPAGTLAVLHADWWVLTRLPAVVLKRREIQRSRLIRDSFLACHGLMTTLVEGLREFARLEFIRAG